jgi:UDP-2,3-diacylglucosamine pyrophosphatase LpxH
MRYVHSGYKGQHDKLNVVLIGDLHYGSPQYNKKILEEAFTFAENNPDNTRIVLMGDLFEVATKTSVGRGIVEQSIGVHDQLRWGKKIFSPYRKLIDGVVMSNHEYRAYEAVDINLLAELAEDLDFPYLGYRGVVKFSKHKRVSYNMDVFHGAGGGTKIASNFNQVKAMSDVVENADIHVMGHVHKRGAFPDRTFRLDPISCTYKLVEKWYVLTGSALEYENGYGEMKGYAPTAIGLPIVTFTMSQENRKVEVKI